MSGDTGKPFDVRLDWGKGPFPVSARRRALHDQIIAHPRDDSLRHVYADLAIEEGDPRGEYVRLALTRDALDEHDDADERRAIQYAMDHLFGRYARSIRSEWTASDVLTLAHARLDLGERGGFVDAIRLRETPQYDRYAQHNEHLNAMQLDMLRQSAERAPITRIQVGAHERSLATIDRARAKSPDAHAQLSRVRRLVAKTRLPIESLSSPGFAIERPEEVRDVRVLFNAQLRVEEREAVLAKVAATFPNLRGAWVGRGSARGLERLGALPHLERLCIAGQFTPELGERVLKSGFPALRDLIFEQGAHPDPTIVATVVNALSVKRLIIHSGIGTRFFIDSAFVRELDGASLRELVLRGAYADKGAARAFGALEMPRLKTLRLVSSGNMRDILGGPLIANLTTLDWGVFGLDDVVMRQLCADGALARVRDLSLAGMMDKKVTQILSRAPALRQIARLRLGQLEPKDTVAVLKNADALRELQLDNAYDETMACITETHHLHRLHSLHVGIGADTKTVAYVNSGAARSLRRLTLTRAHEALVDALVTSPTLHELAHLNTAFDAEHDERLGSRFGPRLKSDRTLTLSRTSAALDPWVR